MAERTISILRTVGNPNKARMIAHLAKHKGETAEDLSKHLGYPLPTVYKYLRELETAMIAESEVKGNVRLYYVSDFKLVISPERLMRAFEGQSALDVYKARFGDDGMKRLSKVMSKVDDGKMTFRQAASTLGTTYYEFVSLLNEIGVIDG